MTAGRKDLLRLLVDLLPAVSFIFALSVLYKIRN